MIDPFGEGEAPAEPVISAARREARPPDRNVAPEAAEGIIDKTPEASMSSDDRFLSERYPRSSAYHPEWVVKNGMTAANTLWLTEWLAGANGPAARNEGS